MTVLMFQQILDQKLQLVASGQREEPPDGEEGRLPPASVALSSAELLAQELLPAESLREATAACESLLSTCISQLEDDMQCFQTQMEEAVIASSSSQNMGLLLVPSIIFRCPYCVVSETDPRNGSMQWFFPIFDERVRDQEQEERLNTLTKLDCETILLRWLTYHTKTFMEQCPKIVGLSSPPDLKVDLDDGHILLVRVHFTSRLASTWFNTSMLRRKESLQVLLDLPSYLKQNLQEHKSRCGSVGVAGKRFGV